MEVPNLVIELDTVNPDTNEAVGGRQMGAYVVGGDDDPGIVDIYKATGTNVNSMRRDKYQHVISRYTGVPKEFKEGVTCRGFTEELVALVVRYMGKSVVGNEKWFRNQ